MIFIKTLAQIRKESLCVFIVIFENQKSASLGIKKSRRGFLLTQFFICLISKWCWSILIVSLPVNNLCRLYKSSINL